MRRMTRLFEIVQMLAAARQPLTGDQMAARLEVAPRTLYRDMAALQAMRIPVEGERGVGYVLRPGFTLPPLMFTLEETEAIVLALGLLDRRGDAGLRAAAGQVGEKIAAALPPPLRDRLENGALRVWGRTAALAGLDLALARRAIREELGLRVTYRDEAGQETQRTLRPVALIYYAETANLVAWCEMRQAIRNFRPDRVIEASLSGGHFRGQGDRLRRLWEKGWTRESDPPAQGAAP